MTWREKTIARLLLLIARMLCEDSEIAAELKYLSAHISTSTTVEAAQGGRRQ